MVERGLHSGDHEFALYAGINRNIMRLISGDPLEDVHHEQVGYYDVIERHGLLFHGAFQDIWERMVYRLRGQYSRLVGVIGIDQQQIKDARVPGAGHVQLVIQGDDRTLFEGPVSWQDEQPLELEIDVANVSRLTVLVDYGEGIDRSDFVDLCELRVIK